VDCDQNRVHGERSVETDPREAEVLVDEQEQKPEADDQAFLHQERAGADVQEESHHGIRFESTAIEPSHREEGIADVQQEDTYQQSDIAARVAVDVARMIFVASTGSPSLRREEARPRARGNIATIACTTIAAIP